MKISKKRTAISVMLFCSLQMSMLCISSVITELAAAFPEYEISKIQFLATVPDLMIVIMSVLCGRVITYTDKRKWVMLSGILFIITALGGYLYHGSYFVLVVWSVTLGTAIGILIPTAVAVINQEFMDDEKEKMLGLQNFAVGFGGIIVTIVCGILTSGGWNRSYLTYFLIIPGMAGMIYSLRDSRSIGKDTGKKGLKINWKQMIFYSVTVFFFFSLYNSLPTNISDILAEKGFRGTMMSSVAIGFLLGGCAAGGILFDRIFARAEIYTILAGFGCLMIGTVVSGISEYYPIILVGMFIAGMSLSLVMATASAMLMKSGDLASANLSVTVMLACSDCGGFFSPVYTVCENVLFGTGSAAARMKIVEIIAAVVAVLFIIVGKIMVILKNRKRI